MRMVGIASVLICCAMPVSGACAQEQDSGWPTFLSYLNDFVDRMWCRVPDPAAAACKGKIAARAVRRCVSTEVPPPTEFQKPLRPIVRAFENCEKRIHEENEKEVLPYLDSTLAVIEAEHGRNSTPYANALTQVINLLANVANRFDLVRPYSEEAIAVSREVYGNHHRETALVLNTHADVITRPRKDEYAEEAIPLLREATDIRRRLIGADHEETAFGQLKLACLLFLKWQRSENGLSRTNLLDEVERLASHAASVLRASKDLAYLQRADALLGRIAYARGEYEKAVVHFETAFPPPDPFVRILDGSPIEEGACREYADALRKLGREEEAKAIDELAKEVEGWIEMTDD